MGKTRICGKRCHNAKTPHCRCWCGGMFHGAAGEGARFDFGREFATEKLPTTKAAFDVFTQARLFDGNRNRASWRDQYANHVGAQQLDTMMRQRRHRRPKGE